MMKKTNTCVLCCRDDRWRGSAAGSGSSPRPWCRRCLADHGTEREDGGVIPGRAPDIAADQNPARDRVEREQQHDEAEILSQHGVDEGRRHRRDPAKPAQRGQGQCRPCGGNLSVMPRARTSGNSSGQTAMDDGRPANGSAYGHVSAAPSRVAACASRGTMNSNDAASAVPHALTRLTARTPCRACRPIAASVRVRSCDQIPNRFVDGRCAHHNSHHPFARLMKFRAISIAPKLSRSL